MDFEPNWPFDTNSVTWKLPFTYLECLRAVTSRTVALMKAPLARNRQQAKWEDRAWGLAHPTSHSPAEV